MAQIATLSNLQLELLKLYANGVDGEQLHDIKRMLGDYFAQKATESMDTVWEEQNLTEADMKNWANEHYRSENRP